MKTKQKFLSLLLCIAMLFSLCPTTIFAEAATWDSDDFAAALEGLNEAVTTPSNIVLLADDNDFAIMSGASHLKGRQGSNVYYGNYYQSDTSGQIKEPVKWQVLKNADGKLFLFANQNLDVQKYHNDFIDITWENCNLRQWLNNDFYNTAFSEKEKERVRETINENADTVVGNQIGDGGEDTKDKVFLLSYNEYWKTSGYFKSVASRIGTNTAYVAAGGTINSSTVEGVGEPNRWWLRSPSYHNNTYALYVMSGKEKDDVPGYPNLYGDVVISHLNAVRPAFNLDLDAVLFSSAAAGGKPEGGLQAIEDYTGDEWKLTLKDDTREGFTASKANDHTITYSGAQTGDNEYISVLIADDTGAYTHYGKLKNLTDVGDASGNVEVILPFDMTGKTLYVFNEQCNGDYKTDYASQLISFDSAKNAYTVTNNLTHLTSDNSAAYYMIADNSDYTATLTAESGYLLPENITVTVGGNVLTATEYTYANGVLTIPHGNITGDIIITASGKTIDAKTPIFTASPQGADYTVGDTAVPLSAAASVNDGGTLSYQWYSNTTNSNTGGSAVSGAAASTYTPLTTAVGTTYYYCVVTNTNNNATGAKIATAASTAAKIEVTAPPAAKYTVTVQTDGNGTASAAPASAAAGTTVTLTAAANLGFHFKAWQVVSGDVTITDNSFIMPAENVIVKATFEKDTVQSKIETSDITEVPEGLKDTPFNTVAAIKNELTRLLMTQAGYTTANTALFDVRLQISTDGGQTWIDADEENFPAEGITVMLPYPSGTGKTTHNFVVTHMFTVTSLRLGTTAGQTEQPAVRKTDTGLEVTLKGLSPVGIAWKAIGSDTSGTGDNSGSVSGGDAAPTYYTLTFETNGGGSIDAVKKISGTKIDLTEYQPTRKDYDFNGWYADKALTEKITAVQLNSNKTIYAGWTKQAAPIEPSKENPFTDVRESDWFYDDVLFVYDKGIMTGTGRTTFSPYQTVTRGMMAAVIWRMEGSPKADDSSELKDVPQDSYYTEAVQWAMARGIMNGYGGGMFYPDEPVTREQLAGILSNYAKYKGCDLTLADSLTGFADKDNVSDWARNAMQWAVGSGLISGKGSGILDPRGTAARAEIAAMLHRFVEKYELAD